MAKPTTKKRVKATKAKKKPHVSHERFDRNVYHPLPLLDAGEAIALAKALLAAKPKKATPAISAEAKRLGGALDRAKAAHRGGKDQKSLDLAMDRAWVAFVRRIHDCADLPRERHPDAVEAAKAYAIVRDLSILRLNYLAEFAQIGARLDSLRREGLMDVARTSAGAQFFDEVMHCLKEYGEGIGATAPRERADDDGARLVLIGALGDYVFQVLALAVTGKPDTFSPVEKALRPIAQLKDKRERDRPAPVAPRQPPPHPPVPPRAEASPA
jgi:hypothetical protein